MIVELKKSVMNLMNKKLASSFINCNTRKAIKKTIYCLGLFAIGIMDDGSDDPTWLF